jgi:hypothetical protein
VQISSWVDPDMPSLLREYKMFNPHDVGNEEIYPFTNRYHPLMIHTPKVDASSNIKIHLHQLSRKTHVQTVFPPYYVLELVHN